MRGSVGRHCFGEYERTDDLNFLQAKSLPIYASFGLYSTRVLSLPTRKLPDIYKTPGASTPFTVARWPPLVMLYSCGIQESLQISYSV